jgi:hypothetical protein
MRRTRRRRGARDAQRFGEHTRPRVLVFGALAETFCSETLQLYVCIVSRL